MDDKANEDLTLQKYITLMKEIKERINKINELIHKSLSNPESQENLELMFFQLRKILEIIAKSSMIINEEEYRNISKNPELDWRIGDIMKKLRDSNPNYYPSPINIISSPDDYDVFEVMKDGFLTEKDLIEAYSYCNSYLHSENPLKLQKTIDLENEIDWIVNIINKIIMLLSNHVCHPLINGKFYYISMRNVKGEISGNIFNKVDKPPKSIK